MTNVTARCSVPRDAPTVALPQPPRCCRRRPATMSVAPPSADAAPPTMLARCVVETLTAFESRLPQLSLSTSAAGRAVVGRDAAARAQLASLDTRFATVFMQ